jgi:hypothetical protein
LAARNAADEPPTWQIIIDDEVVFVRVRLFAFLWYYVKIMYGDNRYVLQGNKHCCKTQNGDYLIMSSSKK